MNEEGSPKGKVAGLLDDLPVGRLAHEAKDFLGAYAEKALASAGEKAGQKVSDTAHNLLQRAEQEDGGGPKVKAALSGVGALTEGKGPVRAAVSAGMTGLKEKIKKAGRGGQRKLKLTNIVETIDVGVPLRLAYDQWTQFEDFPTFTKKVEQAEQTDEGKSTWKAQVWWSHRTWEASIVEQVPDDHIIWKSKGAKGHVDGAVSFSELAPNLTRICLVMEYHPQGLFERTGNLWRAQGRRARLELKHFRRHMMAHAILEADEIQGWRGEIRDGEVVKSHEDALEEERSGHEEETAERERSGREESEQEEPYDEEESYEDAESGEEEEPREKEEPREGEESYEEEPYEEEGEEEPRGERQRRPRRQPAPSGEEERSRRPARRRPGTEQEERPTRGRQPSRRGS
ncbi:SRPBCC family protein [Actinocorallia aurantiaca]|uniref:Coenzyme Q-binding protein COQ10 START domain-containing protein n=1 Tax=Actinocorallia aurantiaca TaxID=46204 RepID=A0ABP6GB44_9ACTN